MYAFTQMLDKFSPVHRPSIVSLELVFLREDYEWLSSSADYNEYAIEKHKETELKGEFIDKSAVLRQYQCGCNEWNLLFLEI